MPAHLDLCVPLWAHTRFLGDSLTRSLTSRLLQRRSARLGSPRPQHGRPVVCVSPRPVRPAHRPADAASTLAADMSSSWWEQVTSHMSQGVRREGANEVWAERSLPQGLIAALMGTIQERLYPDKEITRSMLRTGHWESFIRSLDHELQMMLLKSRRVLRACHFSSVLPPDGIPRRYHHPL